MSFHIVLLPGDGIGPEVTAAAVKVLETVSQGTDFSYETMSCDFGGIAIDNHGDPYPAATKEACAAADAILLGAVGGPKWDGGTVRPEQGLLGIRKELNLYANLRPTKIFPGMESDSPLTPDRVKGTDFLIVRELTGGLYFGDRTEGDETALDTCSYSRQEVERVARVAFKAAQDRRGRLTSVDKANVLATSRLWRRTVESLKPEFPDVTVEHALVDAMAMHLIRTPSKFDVILTENLFGDILSDEASVLGGSIGLGGSASLSDGQKGLYEPIHGSAPDIAGQDLANPSGAMLSTAMLLRHSAGREDLAARIETAVTKVLESGLRTADMGGSASCTAFGQEVVKAL